LKKIFFPILALVVFFSTSVPSFANSSDQLPQPLWSYTVDDEMNYNFSFRKFGNQLYMKNAGSWYTNSSSLKLNDYANYAILDDTDGTLQSTFKSNRQHYTDWGYMTEIGGKGEIYSIYIENGTYKLRETSKEGKILWSKTFSEKDSYQGIAGMFMLKNKTLLVYIRLNTYKYNIYRFDSAGKQLQKKQLNESVHDYQNGYLITYSSLGNTKARVSFYDDNLNFKFKKDITFRKDDFRGISSDGTVYYTGFDKAKNTTTVLARNTKGTLLWLKTFSGTQGWDNYYERDAYRNEFVILIGNTLYRFNAKGLVGKKQFSSEKAEFEVGEDQTVLVKDKTLLYLLNEKMEVLRIADTASLPKYQKYKYFGHGIVYTFDWDSGVLSKIDWNP